MPDEYEEEQIEGVGTPHARRASTPSGSERGVIYDHELTCVNRDAATYTLVCYHNL